MAKPEETLRAIFAQPRPTNISWREIESALKHFGAEITQGRGSRIRVAFGKGPNAVRAVLHRPHPRREAHAPLVHSVRRLLKEAGVEPRSD
ncbi:MAG: type II toxin-antitoxin system HicA family toxin [Gemmatimonadaceae bacterium]